MGRKTLLSFFLSYYVGPRGNIKKKKKKTRFSIAERNGWKLFESFKEMHCFTLFNHYYPCVAFWSFPPPPHAPPLLKLLSFLRMLKRQEAGIF